jgi:hypothetical protein
VDGEKKHCADYYYSLDFSVALVHMGAEVGFQMQMKEARG